jgi:hypothetical protein
MKGTATSTPNYCQLYTDLERPLSDESEITKIHHDHIVSIACPFTELVTVYVPIWCYHTSLSLRINTCAARSRVYIADIEPGFTCSNILDWYHKYKGEYVVQINGHPCSRKPLSSGSSPRLSSQLLHFLTLCWN